MKKIILVLTAALLLPTMAFATHIEVSGGADCDGWDASVAVVFSQYALKGDLTYSVVLYDDTGAEVTRDEMTVPLTYDVGGANTHAFSGQWGMELCGDYTVVGSVSMDFQRPDGTTYAADSGEFTGAFTCICEEDPGIEVGGGADCDGWNASVDIMCTPSAQTGELTYAVMLIDAAGAEVMSGGATVAITCGEGPFTYGGMWDMELCGDFRYVVTVSMDFFADDGSVYATDSGEFSGAFTCICDEPGGCFFTPGYWKNHEEMWPVMSLTLGGVEYTQAELLVILDTPVRGDATIIAAYHLIAAKLNVLNGSADLVGDTISAMDAMLVDNPIGSKPGNPARDLILDHKDILADYNEQGCVDDDDDYSKSLNFEKALEPTTWGSVKTIFR